MRGPRTQQSEEAKNVTPLHLNQCLAKSLKMPGGQVIPGRLVLSHCQIVGEVARAMVKRMPGWLRTELFPSGSELIAAAHDIGKASPTFQKKIYSAMTDRNTSVLATLQGFSADIEKQWGGHAGVSQVTAEGIGVGKYIPEILGQHHGFSPDVAKYMADSEVFGGDAWNAGRIELLAQLKSTLACDFPVVDHVIKARVLAGLTTVADWIGSGSMFDRADDDGPEKIENALDAAGYIQPQVKSGMTFMEVFGFVPKETQQRLIAAANHPGVYVLEAPMGLGKTEAALFAAYHLLQRKEVTGIYFALPTQLTSDKIHERMNLFLQNILADGSPHKRALLLHGNAWLKQFEMGGEEVNPGGAWFTQGKRGILAPFAVGTIDQALMAVMNVKHGFVRTFGLAGKVVILDEVHSYDSFTGTILDELVKSLRQLRCTVIILSATLTRDRRAKLLGITPHAAAYPLITAQPNDGDVAEIDVDIIPDVTVAIAHQPDSNAIEEALRRAEAGQQVLWIENTVNEAQEHYKQLSARASGMDVDCGLLHSRFTKADRAANEDVWVTLFGKNSVARGLRGRILVGTQVVEQSLDIDADFLITRIAPTDMLLQRVGRLWRHSDMVRPLLSQREAWLMAPDLKMAIDAPDSTFGATANVYSPYVLCRSLAVWQDVSHIALPSQIRDLIEETYAQQDECEGMTKHLQQMEAGRDKLERLALIGLSKYGVTLSEDKAQTRHSDVESTEVLLLRHYQPRNDGVTVTFLDGTKLFVPVNGRSLPRSTWRDVAATLLLNTLRVAEYLAPKPVNRQQIEWLGDYFYLGKPEYQESVMLRLALVNQDDMLRSIDGTVINDKYRLSYNAKSGYLARKINQRSERECE
ncbi:MAG: CRISPR-associated helicase Cas3' [Acidithiobacillus ferrivorans]